MSEDSVGHKQVTDGLRSPGKREKGFSEAEFSVLSNCDKSGWGYMDGNP